MKSLFKALALILLVLIIAVPGFAQINTAGDVSLIKYARVFPLTNGNTFTLTSTTNIANGAFTVFNPTTPFPLQPGRGFAVNMEIVGTNSGTAAVTPYFQVATPVTNGTTLSTNWSQYIPGPALGMNGTTRVYGWGLVAATSVDHAQLCRLAGVSNAHTAYVTISATNTYVVIQP